VREINVRFNPELNLVEPARRFIYEGYLTKVDKTGKDQFYTFFLLNDLLLYAAGGSGPSSDSNSNSNSNNNNNSAVMVDGLKSSGLKLHGRLEIDRAFWIKDVPWHEKYQDLAFEIHSSITSFIAHGSNSAVKRKWMCMDCLAQMVTERCRRM
jgi:hypothetical protein